MKIHKEGYKIILIAFLTLSALAVLIHFLLAHFDLVRYLLYFSAVVFWFLIIRFFRYPSRVLEPDENAIYAPADGKIVIIKDLMENKYLQEERTQISDRKSTRLNSSH